MSRLEPCHFGNKAVRLLGEDLGYHLPMIHLQPLAAGDFQFAAVEAQEVQDGGVNVGHVVGVLNGMEAQLVGGAVDEAPLDAGTGKKD